MKVVFFHALPATNTIFLGLKHDILLLRKRNFATCGEYIMRHKMTKNKEKRN